MKPPTRFERWVRAHRRGVRIAVMGYAVALFALMTYAFLSDGAVPFYLVTAIGNASMIIMLVTILPNLGGAKQDLTSRHDPTDEHERIRPDH